MRGSNLDNYLLEGLKTKMERLWAETFHDSACYISLVFDTYFNPDNVFVQFDGDELISSLLAVPYDFFVPDKGKGRFLKGMYLCGLATKPGYRNRGLMCNLMQEAEADFESRGFDLSFLIPADNHLRSYYSGMGYCDSSFRRKIQMTGKPSSEFLDVHRVRDLIKFHDYTRTEILAEWCRQQELKYCHASILHSKKDFLTIFKENENSIFLTKDTSHLKYPILANPIAVAFPEIEDGDEMRVTVKDIFINQDETETQDAMLALCRYFGVSEISLLKSVCNLNEIRIEGKPYAMIKPLGNQKESAEFMNHLFRISLMLD